MKEIVLSVPDISCGHCQESIEGGLGEVDGVGSVQVDIDAKTVSLSFDPSKVTEQLIDTNLEDLGYEVAR
jgi:copper ion binding protein